MGAGCAGTGSDKEPGMGTFARLGQGLRADGTHTNPNPNPGESSPPLFQSSWSKHSLNKGQSNILAPLMWGTCTVLAKQISHFKFYI